MLRKCKKHLFFALFGDGDTRGGDIGFAGLNSGDDRVESHILNFELIPESFGNSADDFWVYSVYFVISQILIGRESGIGRHDQTVLFIVIASAAENNR